MEHAEQFCDWTDPVEDPMSFCMQSLSRCCAALAGNSPFTNDAMLGHSVRIAQHVAALATANDTIFR
eukprot:5752738-Pyramimonas_sp.AAC.1